MKRTDFTEGPIFMPLCFFGFYNGCEKTKFVMAQGIIGALCFRMPLSWLVSQMEPVTVFHIGLANPLSSIVQVSICTMYLLLIRKKLLRGK